MIVSNIVIMTCWLLSLSFLALHGRTPWRARPAGVAVFVMAVVTAAVLTLVVLRTVFGLTLPEWFRVLVYGGILVGLAWKNVTILRYEFGDAGRPTATLNPGTRQSDHEESR